MQDIFKSTPSESIGESFQARQDFLDAFAKRRFKTLRDIPPPKNAQGLLDPGIADLVRVLNPLGLQTQGSCEGHLLDESRFPFPWVTTYGMGASREMKRDVQKTLLSGYNAKNKVQWIASAEGGIEPISPATNEEELRDLQTSAQELAEYIFAKYLKGRRVKHVRLFPDAFQYKID